MRALPIISALYAASAARSLSSPRLTLLKISPSKAASRKAVLAPIPRKGVYVVQGIAPERDPALAQGAIDTGET
jgi:hypothetical protein